MEIGVLNLMARKDHTLTLRNVGGERGAGGEAYPRRGRPLTALVTH